MIFNRLKSWGLVVVVWIGLFMVFFLIGEICFRVFRHEDNPLVDITQANRKYLIKPNTVKTMHSSIPGEFEYTYRINSLGYRGHEFNPQKGPHTPRILAVGDSFTFGVGAEYRETIPALIERNLKEQGYSVEVINAGIGHASPIQHYVNLRDIHLQYQPDLVILFFDLTDLWDDWHSERNAVYDKSGEIKYFDPLFINGKRDGWLTCVQYSAFCRYMNNKLVRTFQKIRDLGFKKYMKAVLEGKRAKAVIATSEEIKSSKTLIEYDGLLMMRGKAKEALIRENFQRTAKYLNKIKGLLAERHMSFVIVMYPHGIYVGPDQWSEGRVTWGFEKNKVYTDYLPFDIVGDYAREQQIPFINTLGDFLKADKSKKYFYDWDGHMTPAGYRIVAQGVINDPGFKKILNKDKVDLRKKGRSNLSGLGFASR